MVYLILISNLIWSFSLSFRKISYVGSFPLCLVLENVGEKGKENGLGKKQYTYTHTHTHTHTHIYIYILFFELTVFEFHLVLGKR